jgi:sugar O-acyltransferase (sialic acid O-acetyltransferase NeuD family)
VIDARTAVTVIGAGGHARVVVGTLLACGYEIAAIVDDDPRKVGSSILDLPVLAGGTAHLGSAPRAAVLAVGNNHARQALALRLPHLCWVRAVHPHSFVHASATIGPGSVVLAGAVVQPEARIGAHAIINTGATVDHDCTVGDYAHLAPGVHLCGEVEVGEGALLGVGAVVCPRVRLGAWSTLGAGASLIVDLPEGRTAAGVPARLLAAE